MGWVLQEKTSSSEDPVIEFPEWPKITNPRETKQEHQKLNSQRQNQIRVSSKKQGLDGARMEWKHMKVEFEVTVTSSLGLQGVQAVV